MSTHTPFATFEHEQTDFVWIPSEVEPLHARLKANIIISQSNAPHDSKHMLTANSTFRPVKNSLFAATIGIRFSLCNCKTGGNSQKFLPQHLFTELLSQL